MVMNPIPWDRILEKSPKKQIQETDKDNLHPWRLTWIIIMEVWKIIFLSKWAICRFYVNLPGCTFQVKNFFSMVIYPWDRIRKKAKFEKEVAVAYRWANIHGARICKNHLTPPKINSWNLKMMVWKMIFLYQGRLVRFHVTLPGCTKNRDKLHGWYPIYHRILKLLAPKLPIQYLDRRSCRFF